MEEAKKEIKEEPKEEKVDKPDENIIRMGRKPFQNYLMALNSLLVRDIPTIRIQGRGKLTSRVLDLAEFGKRVHGLKCPIDSDHWKIESKEFESRLEQGKKTYVTALEIVLEK